MSGTTQTGARSEAGRILISIEDAVLALDMETALSSAGFAVERLSPAGAAEIPPVSLSLAAIDPGESWDTALPLYRQLQARQVPCVLFTADESCATLPPELRGARLLVKPIVSDAFLAEVRARIGG